MSDGLRRAWRERFGGKSAKGGLDAICHIVTPIGMLGYGLNEHQTADDLRRYVTTNIPTAIILDSGSTDSGPDKLALGSMTCPRSAYVRDLTKLLKLVHEFSVPLIFSSAGGDGTDDHVRELMDVIEEICEEDGNEECRFKTIGIFSNIEKAFVRERLCENAISECGKVVPPLRAEDIDSVPRIASQMGPEPFIDAMNANPDFNVIVGGRAYDPSPYVAYAAFVAKTSLSETSSPESKQLWGGFTHMGKIMECGGSCAKPKCAGASVTVYTNGTFDITPSDPDARCTPLSVSAHGLYEKSRPDILSGPGGYLDLTKTWYEQLSNDRTLRVRGGMFTFSRDAGLPYQVKLEAASVIGYRAMYMGSFKDPILISYLDILLPRIKGYVSTQHEDVGGKWALDFHTYGRDQVSALPENAGEASEVFLIGEALADTQDLASSIASAARIATVHAPYPGQKATSGNLAYGLGGKMIIDLGPCSKFSIYHLMNLTQGEERLKNSENENGLFSQVVGTIGKGKNKLVVKDTNGFGIPFEPLGPKGIEEHTYGGTTKMQKAHDQQQKLPESLGDLASVLRSKNSGPFELTFDVLFDTEKVYQLVKDSDILNKTVVSHLLGVQEADIIWIGFFDQALAFKATIPRLRKGKIEPNGGYMENDVHGSQKYLGLLNMKLPKDFVQTLGASLAP
ncbi:hypothetical protein B0J11DRAFT_608191 [Dendryphion nanum]|uniref:Caib baif family enzyme n=1 Tax=Dendryphion nanum TaxID=256645 RepID=A0A9P9DP28_9PLEO|nr:hypothetical protein B0J11DRAFT_608191 [Dendryphion nanum]